MSNYLQSEAYREAKSEMFRTEVAFTGWSMATTALVMGAFFAFTIGGPLAIGLAALSGVGALGCGVKSYFTKVDLESARHAMNSQISASHIRDAMGEDGPTNQEKRALAVQQMMEGAEEQSKPKGKSWGERVQEGAELAGHAAAHTLH